MVSNRVATLGGALAAAAFQFFVANAFALDPPTFRAGMWEFVRTVEGGPGGKPQVLTSSRCTNPTEDMKRQNEKLTQIGCKFSDAARNGKVYTFTAQCNVHGTAMESKTVLTAESDSAYGLRVESKEGQQTGVETLKARRTGDCAK